MPCIAPPTAVSVAITIFAGGTQPHSPATYGHPPGQPTPVVDILEDKDGNLSFRDADPAQWQDITFTLAGAVPPTLAATGAFMASPDADKGRLAVLPANGNNEWACYERISNYKIRALYKRPMSASPETWYKLVTVNDVLPDPRIKNGGNGIWDWWKRYRLLIGLLVILLLGGGLLGHRLKRR